MNDMEGRRDPDAERRAAMGDEHVERRRRQLAEEARISNSALRVGVAASAPRRLTTTEMIRSAIYVEEGKYVLLEPYELRGLGAAMALMTLDEARSALRQCWELQRVRNRETGGEEERPVAVLQAWLDHAQARSVNRAMGAIGQPPIFERKDATGTKKIANLWRGRVRPKWTDFSPGERREMRRCVRAFVRHIRYIFPKEHRDFLDFLAHIEQRPDVKPQFCWVNFTPTYGTGRNLIATWLNRIWPGEVALNVDMEQVLLGGFNQHIEMKRLAVVDELHFGDNLSNHRGASKLRQFVTQEEQVINRKYGAQYTEQDVKRLLIFTNKPHSLPMEKHDRRIRVARGPEEPRSPDYYRAMYAYRDQPLFAEAVGLYLAHRDIRHFNPGERAPMNEAKMELVRATQSTLQADFSDILPRWPSDFATIRDLRAALGIDKNDKRGIAELRHALTEHKCKTFDRRLETKLPHGTALVVVEDHVYVLPLPRLPRGELPAPGDESAWASIREALPEYWEALKARAEERVRFGDRKRIESRAVAAINAYRGVAGDAPCREVGEARAASVLFQSLMSRAGDYDARPL